MCAIIKKDRNFLFLIWQKVEKFYRESFTGFINKKKIINLSVCSVDIDPNDRSAFGMNRLYCI